ncbi:50S ribosomal protein L9p [Chitinispirillum alkaliphilum]|nr:50S ribosomal protein L9p [Chitinispirillum alkaliphilum]
MQVVLMKDYGNLGKAMDVVTVKDGYARNYLIPSGVAVPATEGNKKIVAQAKNSAEKREEKKLKEARQLAKKIEQVPCTIPVKVGEEEKIFGSVTSQEIADLLNKEGFNIDKKAVGLDEPIKQLGVYNVKVNLYKDVYAKVKVWVVKEEK